MQIVKTIFENKKLLIIYLILFYSIAYFASKQLTLKGYGNYYNVEYIGMSDAIENNTSLDFEKVRRWRRGPASFLWLAPIASVFKTDISPYFFKFAETFIVILCVIFIVKIYANRKKYLFEIPIYSIIILSCNPLSYQLTLGDINAILCLCLMPILSYYFLSKNSYNKSAIFMVIGAHLRILPVAGLFYLFIKKYRTIFTIIITTVVILALGTIVLGKLHGYLYWQTLVIDVLFNSQAATGWHEDISISGTIMKIFNNFYYGKSYGLVLSSDKFRTAKIIASLIQLSFFTAFTVVVLKNKKIKDKLSAEKVRELFLIEIGLASLLTYYITPESVLNLLSALIPLYCTGMYFVINRKGFLSKKLIAMYFISLILVFNVAPNTVIATILPVVKINELLGNITMTTYEAYNLLSIPVIGILLITIFTFVLWNKVYKEVK